MIFCIVKINDCQVLFICLSAFSSFNISLYEGNYRTQELFWNLQLLLDSVTDYLSIYEIRQLMDILCMIAFSDPDDVSLDMTSLQDEIYMIVQKQLACPDLW